MQRQRNYEKRLTPLDLQQKNERCVGLFFVLLYLFNIYTHTHIYICIYIFVFVVLSSFLPLGLYFCFLVHGTTERCRSQHRSVGLCEERPCVLPMSGSRNSASRHVLLCQSGFESRLWYVRCAMFACVRACTCLYVCVCSPLYQDVHVCTRVRKAIVLSILAMPRCCLLRC